MGFFSIFSQCYHGKKASILSLYKYLCFSVKKKKNHKTYTHVVAAVPVVSLDEMSGVTCLDPKTVSSGNKTFMVFGDLESALGFELERLSFMATIFESGKLQLRVYHTI